MKASKIFKGKIKVLTNKKSFKTLSFSFDLHDYHINDLVMSNFEDIEFSEKEKRELTTKHREVIKEYQSINPKQLRKLSVELAKIIKQANGDRIDIEAEDAGTFICLSSIFSGKLPKEKEIYFHLKSSPVLLFPRTFVKDKNAGHSFSINFLSCSDCWLRSFTSLTRSPSYLSLASSKEADLDEAFEKSFLIS